MDAQCAAIKANFAWFSQRCPNRATATVWQDGEEWPVCAEHAEQAEQVTS